MLCKSELFIERKSSFMEMLKSIGPNIERCNTPDISTALYMLFNLTFCLLRFGYE